MSDGPLEFEGTKDFETPIDYDKILNPSGALPKTELVEKPKPKMNRSLRFDIHNEDHVKIGNLMLYRLKNQKKY